MIQQPELGRKIAELRKTKGLTQEELVEKCNLNVRTLQRIESEEVMPRTYTIKLIFEALELPFENSLNDKGLTHEWLKQFCLGFINLFNLKTNTMKKITILSIIVALVVLMINSTKTDLVAQTNEYDSLTVDKNLGWPRGLDLKNFSSGTSFSENELYTGMNVKFNYYNTHIETELISINTEKKEFNIGFLKGIFRKDRLDIIANEMFFINFAKYSADKIEKTENSVYLLGNAKIISHCKNYLIESDELLITFKKY